MTDSLPLYVMLARCGFTIFPVSFGSFSCWQLKLLPITFFPDGIAW